jgi:hypothetical protein
MNDDLTLGKLLGRREAFKLVAARCSAAEVATLREIREQKLYLSYAKDWGEFCERRLHTNKQNVNREIRILEEFGSSYYEVSQLTRISPSTYRAIAPWIRDQAIHHNGEAIALIPENAEKVAAAVAELRKAATVAEPAAEPEAPPEELLDLLEEECRGLSAKLEQAIPTVGDRRWRLKLTVCGLRDRLNRLEVMI